ncbi:tetratricopeptide repeat protein [Sporomusa sphaeroides]|uniref:HTH-type transcriptional regulator MalT n=1 Tax=Sporomusa sphaeroides DSM 2875 TaxID=1337886 RepID=A0ABM9W1Q3_9FIRM|nr:tetratricopeptide repeat protein [Sporomusa sphaeroides]OLS56234.1 HTH-type transcriptional regulator MalT [Sporomusa sphaeroides DSM 2875]CVK19124.1 HTH-type transcriptional regulator MalT [Sporomusa sphaeroides DSM 2875]
MSDLLLLKLMPPRRGSGTIERSGLIKKIAGGGQQFVLLTAPAGYGKTTTMLQLADTAGRTLVWYQLDAHDNDPAVFLRYLTAGIARQLPGFGQQVLPLFAGDFEGRLRLLLTAFVNELYRWEQVPIVLALDDYHEITALFVHRFLEELLNHLPEHVHVMIASRTIPPLDLSQLKASGFVKTVRAGELRFSGEELRVYLIGRGSRFACEDLELLERKVEGWPAAVKFLADLSCVDSPSLFPGGSNTETYEYLAAQVMSRQPDKVVDFLKKTAVLETVTAAACDRLLARQDSRQMLELLEKQNLFLVPLADSGNAYRYHQLFREFLLDQLGNERQFWQRQAGIMARECGELSLAAEYFRAAGAQDELKAILAEAARQALTQGRWQTMSRWLTTLGETDLTDDPWLSLYRARVEMFQGRLDEAEKWLNKAAPFFLDSGSQQGLTETRLLQARVLRCRGRFAESLALLEQVLHQLPLADNTRVDLPLERSSCLLYTGHFREAEAVLVSAFAAAKRRNDKYAKAHILEGLGHVYWMQGDYPRALRMYNKTTERLPEWFMPSYHMQDYIAFIYLDWGEWEKALDYAKRNVAIKENFDLTDALPSAYGQLSSIYCSRGEWTLAEEYCKRSVEFVRENNGDHIYSALSLALWSECLGLQGRWIEAREKAVEALAEVGPYYVLAQDVCLLLGSLSFIHTGELQQGKEMLSTAVNRFDQYGFMRGQCYGYAFQAWLAVSEGKAETARAYTEKVLELAARHNFLNVFLTHYELLQPVLQLGLENGVEVAFIQRILARKLEKAVPLLTCLAKHHDPKVRSRVIAPLAEILGVHAATVITALVKDTDMAVRQSARLAAQRLGIPAAQEDNTPGVFSVSLQVNMLGRFTVFVQDTELGKTGWRTAKTQDLLAYLLHKGEPVSREQIQEDLWPDMDAENAANIFHVTLHRLRKLLKKSNCPDMLAYSGKRYALQSAGFSSDIREFQELAAAGLYQDIAIEEKVHCLKQAAALYRGDYLEGMDYPWLFYGREKFRNLYAEIEITLARYYLDARLYAVALERLQIMEAADPFNEEVQAMLIKAYYGQGNRKALVRQYQKTEVVFREELGLRPSPELQALYAKLVK